MTEFAADRSSSNKTGVTLMNNQVGYVVAEVMRGKPDVTVTELPSMIRVDGKNKVDFDYEEMAEALVGVEALDPALGVLLVALDPVGR